MKKFYALTLIINCLLHAQINPVIGPGGVSGIVTWFKTERQEQNFYGNYRWKDYSGDLLQLKYYDNRGPVYGNEYVVSAKNHLRNYNFNPALGLNWGDYRDANKIVLIKSSNLSTATIIGAFASDGGVNKLDQPAHILTLNGTEGKGVILNTDKIINSKESNRGVLDYGLQEGYDLMYHQGGGSPEPDLTKFKERTLRSFVYFRTNSPNTSVWGERRRSTLSLGDKFYPTSVNNTSTFDISSLDGQLYKAYIPELFIYDRLLTPLERLKTESYLALKYGFMLEKSYIGSSDQLLWDIDQNKEYNHRITGLYRDDKSGLYQKQGTTAYEESPYFSYSVQGDSYENGDPYGLSNRNKLLVVERFPTNTMEDKEYIIWGDNNESLQTQKEEEFLGLNIMKRRWNVQTNMGGRMPEPEKMEWDISPNLEVEQEGYKFSTLKKVASSLEAPGILSSTHPLPGKDGHISFTVTDLIGGIVVKFGTKSIPEEKGGNDYGIFINEKGEVYPIIGGYIQSNSKWGITVKAGDRIRINKTIEALYISDNGWALPQTGHALPQLYIYSQDREKDFYVSIGMYPSSKNSVLKDVRVGGFIDTGNRIDLSYISQRATEFANYRDGKSYLLVDRSGTGEFKKENTDLYPSDEFDGTRQKITFNNVFFDTDLNGKDVFTFAYRPSNIVAEIEKEKETCNIEGISNSDGKIKIKIKRGDDGFEYQLYNEDSLKVVKEGVFYGKQYEIDKVPAGKYTLKLKEIGGYHILSDSTATESKAVSTSLINGSTRGRIVGNTIESSEQAYQIGFSPTTSLATSYVAYGLEINKGKIYQIHQGIVSKEPLPGSDVKIGDKITLDNTQQYYIHYKLNGVTLFSQYYFNSYYYMVKLNNNIGGAYNVKSTPGISWNYQGVKLNQLSESSVEHTIIIESDCNGTSEEKDPNTLKREENDHLVVYYKDFANKSEITANIKLNEPSILTLVIFDLSGKMVYSKNINQSAKEHTVDLTGLEKGMYIMKALTQKEEFTKKIIINN